jgi:hypothetical protein
MSRFMLRRHRSGEHSAQLRVADADCICRSAPVLVRRWDHQFESAFQLVASQEKATGSLRAISAVSAEKCIARQCLLISAVDRFSTVVSSGEKPPNARRCQRFAATYKAPV